MITIKEVGYLALGLSIGWVTKIPFFIKYYKKEKKRQEALAAQIEAFNNYDTHHPPKE